MGQWHGFVPSLHTTASAALVWTGKPHPTHPQLGIGWGLLSSRPLTWAGLCASMDLTSPSGGIEKHEACLSRQPLPGPSGESPSAYQMPNSPSLCRLPSREGMQVPRFCSLAQH